MGFRENIKNKRLEQGLTLEDLAQKIDVSRQTIHRYESGVISNVPSDKVEKIAEALHTTPGYLMGWDDSKKLTFGATIKHLMDNNKLNYKEMVKRTGLDIKEFALLSSAPINKVPTDKLVKIALALGTDITNILDTGNMSAIDYTTALLAYDYEKYHEITELYSSLNSLGRQRALDNLRDLNQIPLYTLNENVELNAAHEIEGATEDEKQHDENLMDNEDLWNN